MECALPERDGKEWQDLNLNESTENLEDNIINKRKIYSIASGYLMSGYGLSDLADKNTGHAFKFEFQIDSE